MGQSVPRRGKENLNNNKFQEKDLMAAKVATEKCTGCGRCVEACSFNAIGIKDGKAVINDDCVECGGCVSECPQEALSV